MKAQANLELSDEQVRALAAQLLVTVEQKEDLIQRKEKTNRHLEAINEKLVHENALLKRHRFARRSETLNQQQCSLLDELIDADIGAIEEELARAREHVAEKPNAQNNNPNGRPYRQTCRVSPSSTSWRTPPAAAAVS